MIKKRLAFVLILSLAVAAMLPAAADEKPADRLQQSLDVIGAHIKNSSMKLKHGIMGFSGRPKGESGRIKKDETPKPVQQCCMGNLKAMESEMATIRVILDDLRKRFKADGNEEGIGIVATMRRSLNNMVTILKAFTGASSSTFADSILGGASEALKELRRGKEKLDACCADLLPKTNQQPQG